MVGLYGCWLGVHEFVNETVVLVRNTMFWDYGISTTINQCVCAKWIGKF